MNLREYWLIYAGLALFVYAGLGYCVWWFVLGNRYYPLEERARTISRALGEQSDLDLTYWAKARRQYKKRVVTPLVLDGKYLRAYDHKRQVERTFKITQIKEIALVPRSKPSASRVT